MDDLIRSGVAPPEAERRARLGFGGHQRYRAECREFLRVHWLDEFGRNVRYAFRTLRKNPTFTAVAILSLAPGIGMDAFLFSVFNSLILRPLPIADPAGVTFIESTTGTTFSFPDCKDFRDRNNTFTGLAGYRISVMNFEHGGEPSRIWCYLATGNYFGVPGVTPRGFHGTEMFYWPEVWIPMMMQPQLEDHSWLDNRATWDTMLPGRLKRGATRPHGR